MFSITVAFGNISCPLLFKTEEHAQAVFNELKLGTVGSIDDDFGRSVYIPEGELRGAVFENMEVAKEGAIESALHNARTQNSAQKRAAADPALRSGMGPAMISPMGGPNGRGF